MNLQVLFLDFHLGNATPLVESSDKQGSCVADELDAEKVCGI